MRSVLIVGDDQFATQLFDFLVHSFPGEPHIQRIAPDDPELPHWLAGADWVIEMAGHDVERKRDALRHCANCATGLVTSDSSVVTRHELLAGLPANFAGRYAVTHFFFPLPYCPLVELVTTSNSDLPLNPALRDRLCDTLRDRLGRIAVDVSDSPGFIANRLGLFFIANGLALMTQGGIDPIAIDRAVAAPLGLPRTALFGTADLIGHPTLKLLLLTLFRRLSPKDPLNLVVPSVITLLDEVMMLGRGRFIDRSTMPKGQDDPDRGVDTSTLIAKLQSDRDCYVQRVCEETGLLPSEVAEIMRKSYGWNVQW
jgi:3-hydroxyacyl-CoA dehydrogenase